MAPGKENPWPGRVDQVLRMLPQDVAVASGTQLIGRFLRQPKGYSGPVAAAYTWESSEVIDTPLYENGRLTYLPEGLVDTQTSAKMTLLSRSDGPPPDPSRPLPQVEVLLWSRHADTVAEVQDTIAQLQEGIMGLEQGESHRGADRTMEMKQRLYGELHRLSILSVHRFSFDMQQAYVREKRQRQGEVVVNSSAAIIFQEYAGGALDLTVVDKRKKPHSKKSQRYIVNTAPPMPGVVQRISEKDRFAYDDLTDVVYDAIAERHGRQRP